MDEENRRQSQRGIEQTDRISKLSFLAYFYIPLTFVASFYGMNFKELGTSLSIWSYFVMAMPLLILLRPKTPSPYFRIQLQYSNTILLQPECKPSNSPH